MPDLAAAKEFYKKALQKETYFDEPSWVVFEVSDYQLWLVAKDAEENFEEANASGTALTYLHVADVKALYHQFIECGAKSVQSPSGPAGFLEAVVEDPWDNRLGIAATPGSY